MWQQRALAILWFRVVELRGRKRATVGSISCRYVDYPITDVLQMMGRAGRPQFDRTAKAVIMVHEPKKGFYKKFLYEPFPVESALHEQLTDHLNAEVVNGTIRRAQDAVDYLTWTYLFQRLPQNPSYYGVPSGEDEEEGGGGAADDAAADARVADHISALVEDALWALQVWYYRTACVRFGLCSCRYTTCSHERVLAQWWLVSCW